MLELEVRSEGVVLPVRARAGAARNALRGEHEGALRVAVTQVAEKGRANKAIAGLLAKALGRPQSDVELLAGGSSPRKKFLIRGAKLEEVRQRLAEHAGED